MLSDAPHASWHPALMPNSISELPRAPPKDLPSSLPSHIDAYERAESTSGSDATDDIHNKSDAPRGWIPDHGAGDDWAADASNAPAGDDVPSQPVTPDATDIDPPIASSPVSKHFSTMSFTRTVPHEVNWNDDDDPEWDLSRTSTDPFKFMPQNDRTNSFPSVPPPEPAEDSGPEEPLAHSQAEDVLQEVEREADRESDAAFNAEPGAFGATFGDDDTDDFHRAIGGDVSGSAEDFPESRFEEGLPLIIPDAEASVQPSDAYDEVNLFAQDDGGEDDDFFSKVQEVKGNQPDDHSPLERKSTMQVLNGLDVGPMNSTFAHPEEAPEEFAHDVPSTFPEENSHAAPPTLNEPEPKAETGEDLDAKWKAMFGDEEVDGFLPDEEVDEFLADEDVDAAGFLGSDDEGFLDDSEAQPAEPSPAPPTSTDTKTQPTNGRYLPQGHLPGSAAPATNSYLPATPSFALPSANSYLPAVGSVLQPPAASPYLASSSVPPALAPYGIAVPPPVQEQNKPQSFVDKAKGGYTSPYDLPMEVVKPKRRAVPHLQRSTSTPNAPLPGPPSGPRSTSMNSPLTPTSAGFGSAIPPPPVSSHGMQPPHSTPKLPNPATKSQEKFFEDLPIVSKPRPTSRQSNKSVPSPAQLSPYAPPPQAGPLPIPSQTAFAPPPRPAQPAADISQLVAPPRVSPYAPLQPTTGLGPVPPPAAAASRYSPAPPTLPSVNGPLPAAAPGRYSAPPPAARPTSSGYSSVPTIAAPPVLPHQPRTSSPLAHFEINHERSRSHAQTHHSEGGGMVEKRSSSSFYDPRLQRVPSLPPTTEVEEEEGALPAQPPSGYVPASVSTSPELRHGQLPQPPRQTPPPPSFHSHLTLSPPKRATSSHGAVAPQPDFHPPPRSQTQSPGKVFGNRNGKPVEPIPRPSSVHEPASPRVPTYPAAYAPGMPASAAAPPTTVSSRQRGFSQNLNLVPPTDGREKGPVQRWRGSPLLSWGVGGTIVTMFPKDVPRYGMNHTIPMVIRSPGEVKVQNAKDLQPLEDRLAKFPGPLKGKSKKKETIAWLNTGIESLERTLPNNLAAQLHSSHDDKRLAERVLLWKILRLFVEHDGALEGNPVVEKSVRDMLSPNLDASVSSPVYITGAQSASLKNTLPTRTQTDAVDSSTVEQIRQHLLNGDREKAVWAAADVRLWGHALLLANALAPDLYKQVAQEFVKKEVNIPGHESLAALYDVLSGNHEESVDELVPAHARHGLQLLSKDTSSGPSKDAMEGLDKWRETLNLVLSNRSSDDGRAINSLGSLLSSYGRAEAAHICFMFARGQTIFGGLDDPNSHFVLLGSDHKRQSEQFAKEIEPLLLSEVYEYGQTLAGGSNMVASSPHLAAYKLQHAYALAEYGFRDKALQYCEAISTAITAQTRRSPYHHPILEAAVEDLTKRLKQAPKEDSGSWKPNMNKVSDSVWSRFHQFVAGDDENGGPGQGSPKDGEASGPFARVGGGTPTISRPPSTNNLETFASAIPNYGVPPTLPNGPPMSTAPPTRAASRYAPGAVQPAGYAPTAYDPSSSYAPRSSMERTSSELNRNSSELRRQSSDLQAGHHNPYSPNRTSSPPQAYTPYGAGLGLPQEPSNPLSPPASLPSHMPPAASAYAPLGYSHAPPNGTISAPDLSTQATETASSYEPPSYGYEPPSFDPYEAPSGKGHGENGIPDSNGEASSFEPPSYQPYGYEPPSYQPDSQPSNEDDESDEQQKPKPKKKGIMYDEDDDMPMPAVKPGEKSKEDKDRENAELFRKAAEEDAKRAAEAKQGGKKGWGFTSWFGAGAKKEPQEVASPNKPVRAKLGEANSFFYDPEQKRWVNKNSDPKDNEAKKATPPPPRSISSSSAPPTSHSDAGLSAPPAGPPRSAMTPPMHGLRPSPSMSTLSGPPSLGPPAMARSVSNTSTASAPPGRPTTSLSNSSSIDDLLSAAGPRKAGTKKPRKSARYVDVMTKD